MHCTVRRAADHLEREIIWVTILCGTLSSVEQHRELRAYRYLTLEAFQLSAVVTLESRTQFGQDRGGVLREN